MKGIKEREEQLKGIKNEQDISRFISRIEADSDAEEEEAFWDERKRTLLRAVIMYLLETRAGPISFGMILDLLREYPVIYGDTENTPLDGIFFRHMRRHPESRAVREYVKFHALGRRTKFTTAICLIGIMEKYE